MLPLLVALPAAAGLLLRGSWDLWAQTLVHAAAAAGTAAWLCACIAGGYLPLPSRRNLAWTGSLAALSAASLWASPVRGLARPEWYNLLNALWIFPVMTAVSKDQRLRVDQAVRAAAWVLVALAFYQRFGHGEDRPAAALVNQNVYAGAILMLLPLAVELGDKALAAGLLVNLWWTRSVGAWLGLFAAVLLTRRRGGPAVWAASAGGLVCLVLIYDKFQSPEVLDRWDWWKAAGAMILDRPLLGYGPGAFAAVLPGYREGGGLGTGYAHQYYLQTAAELGLPFAAVWLAGLWSLLRRGRSHKRFGALAVLVHSLWDWTLSMPANLWLFCYFSASALTQENRGVNVPFRRRLPAAALAAAVGGLVAWRPVALWQAARARSLAEAALEGGDSRRALALAREAAGRAPEDPGTWLLLARLEPEAARGHLERAARADPYRPRTWLDLAAHYRGRGEEALALDALERGARRLPRLRAHLPPEGARE